MSIISHPKKQKNNCKMIHSGSNFNFENSQPCEAYSDILFKPTVCLSEEPKDKIQISKSFGNSLQMLIASVIINSYESNVFNDDTIYKYILYL